MTRRRDNPADLLPLGATELHVLLSLQDGAQYGYAIMKAVDAASGGRISPEIGSLYRMLARLMSGGLVEETSPPGDDEPTHPGRDRRYYRLTARGRAVTAAEVRRLRALLDLPAARKLAPGRSTS
jgi:DNA-binding PadR family transcriptional regulator